jgi:septal ring factor EnvC (AmiA/AmiB activator)
LQQLSKEENSTPPIKNEPNEDDRPLPKQYGNPNRVPSPTAKKDKAKFTQSNLAAMQQEISEMKQYISEVKLNVTQTNQGISEIKDMLLRSNATEHQ